MFEAHVLHLLRRYLGEYVHGLSVEALRISVWKGDVVLKDLKLKAEALNSLKLPVTVKAGFIGTITLKVPWKSLGKEPVIVLIDRVFILAYPLTDGQTLKEDREKLFESKLQQIEETEAATLEAMSKSKLGSPPPGNSWLGSLIAAIIGNLKISISNVHVRYEDSSSNPGHPFCSGVTLAKLAAGTMDEQGNETFDTSGALDKLRKSLQLERLAMYHDSDSVPWTIDKGWEDLTPEEWIQIFEDGIDEPADDSGMVSKWAVNHKYLVSPISGVLKYHRIGNQERNDPEVPFEKASLLLSDVSLTITELLPVLRSRQLLAFVDGTSLCPSAFLSDVTGNASPKPNPAYADWVQKDQLVLSWINGSLGHQALAATARHSTARDVWVALQQRFASTNQSRILQLRTAFFQTKRGDSSISDFLDKINGIADQLALAGAPVSAADMVPVVMSNVGPKFENTVAAAQARDNPISLPDLEALLLAAELRLADSPAPPDSSVSALVASRGSSDRGGDRGSGRFSRGGGRPQHDGSRNNGGDGYRGYRGAGGFHDRPFRDRGGGRPQHDSSRFRGPNNASGVLGPAPSHGSSRPRCQICNTFGHGALDCAQRLNLAYEGRPPSSRLTALTAQHSQPWLLDSGANSHITNDLNTLSQSRDYRGGDSVGGVVGGTGYGDGDDSFFGQE